MRAASSVSDVILFAEIFGMRAASSVSAVILFADMSGIRSTVNTPDVMFAAVRLLKLTLMSMSPDPIKPVRKLYAI